jgi:hypothetical protein
MEISPPFIRSDFRGPSAQRMLGQGVSTRDVAAQAKPALPLHFGLGASNTPGVDIYWRNGLHESWNGSLPINSSLCAAARDA